jgi:hypothetical protein
MEPPEVRSRRISDNQQATRKRVKRERKNGLGAQTMTMVKQNKANRSKQSTIPSKNDNQPDHNGDDLSCDRRQPLSTAVDPPNPPPSIFEIAEVVENRKVSFGESVGPRN